MLKLRASCFVTLVATLIFVAWPASAQAGFKLRISDGSNTLTISDNGPNDGSGTTDKIRYESSFSGLFANFDLDLVAISKPTIAGWLPNESLIDLSSITATALAAGTLTIELTRTGYTLPAANAALLSSLNIVGISNVTATFQSWVNYGPMGNNEFGTVGGTNNFVATPGLQTPPPFPNTVVLDNAVPAEFLGPDNFFSLTSRLVLTFGAGGSFTSLDGMTSLSNPEPATIVSAFAGLPILGIWWRRRKALLALAA